MDLLDDQLKLLNGKIKEITSEIKRLYGRLDSLQDLPTRKELKERIAKLKKKESEINDQRRKLKNKLPGGMPSKGCRIAYSFSL